MAGSSRESPRSIACRLLPAPRGALEGRDAAEEAKKADPAEPLAWLSLANATALDDRNKVRSAAGKASSWHPEKGIHAYLDA